MSNKGINISLQSAPVQQFRNESDQEFNSTLASESNRRFERVHDKTLDLCERTKAARDFIEFHVTHVKSKWLDWVEESDKIMKDIQQTRVATEFESRQLLSACADVRKFFLSEEHAKEVCRLKEFVEVVERLRALKKDGTLDAVADTILKLSGS